jgi:hypothetical protein
MAVTKVNLIMNEYGWKLKLPGNYGSSPQYLTLKQYQFNGSWVGTRSETDVQNKRDLSFIFSKVNLQAGSSAWPSLQDGSTPDWAKRHNSRVQRLGNPVFPQVSWGVNNLATLRSPTRQIFKAAHTKGSSRFLSTCLQSASGRFVSSSFEQHESIITYYIRASEHLQKSNSIQQSS